jgi:hypothetical protein
MACVVDLLIQVGRHVVHTRCGAGGLTLDARSMAARSTLPERVTAPGRAGVTRTQLARRSRFPRRPRALRRVRRATVLSSAPSARSCAT